MRFARCDWPRRRTITRDPHCQPAVVAMLIAIMVIAGCGDSPSDADGPAVAAVEVTAPASYLATGATLQLSARTLDAAGGLVSGQAISWSSSPSAVASVDGGGLVRGLSPARRGRTGSINRAKQQARKSSSPPAIPGSACREAIPAGSQPRRSWSRGSAGAAMVIRPS